MERRRRKLPLHGDSPTDGGLAFVRFHGSDSEPATNRDRDWRANGRTEALARAVAQTADLDWSPRLLRLLLEELYVDEEFEDLLGPANTIAITGFPQAIAVALALRYSWRRDTLEEFLRRLDLRRCLSRR
jgi:hypothetical protein